LQLQQQQQQQQRRRLLKELLLQSIRPRADATGPADDSLI